MVCVCGKFPLVRHSRANLLRLKITQARGLCRAAAAARRRDLRGRKAMVHWRRQAGDLGGREKRKITSKNADANTRHRPHSRGETRSTKSITHSPSSNRCQDQGRAPQKQVLPVHTAAASKTNKSRTCIQADRQD